MTPKTPEQIRQDEEEWLARYPTAENPCGELSSESRTPCRLPKGHKLAHEGVRGPYQLVSWPQSFEGTIAPHGYEIQGPGK